ncbi:HlyD family secretion protein [Tsuneonella amylolytica]|uniref:HlyD family secretion protein n=1 Tax=Tsuneonella amylolytica TaxID=2338327 RepID=UPI000EAA369A|nr:HlyD family secretion protein [Tsuneonella amylolytica]
MTETSASPLAEPNDTPADGQEPVVPTSKRRGLFIKLAVVVVVLGAIWLAYELVIGTRTVSTDNAYVQGQNAMVTPLVAGQIVAVPVVETQTVKKGQVLLRIDDTDQRIAFDRARADLLAARRGYDAVQAQGRAQWQQAAAQGAMVTEARAQLSAARSELAKAQVDYDRRRALQGTGAVSADEVTAAAAAVQTARARVEQVSASVAQQERQRQAAIANRAATLAPITGSSVDSAPAVQQAAAALEAARIDLERTVVRAPVDGVVAQLSAQVGQMVQRGAPVMTVVPVGQLYVDANFKENQLGKVRVGQAATLTSSFYGGDVVFHGRVIGFAGGTGAAFAPIPAQNASGNWIKVVQRLPVRIALDPKELAAHPLRVGLSMDAEIDVAGGD